MLKYFRPSFPNCESTTVSYSCSANNCESTTVSYSCSANTCESTTVSYSCSPNIGKIKVTRDTSDQTSVNIVIINQYIQESRLLVLNDPLSFYLTDFLSQVVLIKN